MNLGPCLTYIHNGKCYRLLFDCQVTKALQFHNQFIELNVLAARLSQFEFNV